MSQEPSSEQGRGRVPWKVSTAMSARACAERRIMLGLTQQQLAELIWVAYQQAHKYERDTNRMAAGRLIRPRSCSG
jgi:hypothetical protein